MVMGLNHLPLTGLVSDGWMDVKIHLFVHKLNPLSYGKNSVFFFCACVHGRNKVALIKVLLPSSKDGGKRFHLKQTPPKAGSSFSKELFLFFTVRNNRAWRYPRVFASGPCLCTFFFFFSPTLLARIPCGHCNAPSSHFHRWNFKIHSRAWKS